MGQRSPLPKRTLSTRLVRVPTLDWPRLSQGLKTEIRLTSYGASVVRDLEPPTPVVCYAPRRFGELPSGLFVVEDTWKEALGAISKESLEREGFESLADFRRYWRRRSHDHAFKPLMAVYVLRLRPYRPADREELADGLFSRLYRRWLDEAK